MTDFFPFLLLFSVLAVLGWFLVVWVVAFVGMRAFSPSARRMREARFLRSVRADRGES